MRQMIRLFAAASTQPSQHLLPTRIVDTTVRTQDKQSSRNTSESTSNLMSTIVLRMGSLMLDRGPEDVTLVTRATPRSPPSGSTTSGVEGRVGVSRIGRARPHEAQKRTFSEDATPQPEQVIMRTDCIVPRPRERSPFTALAMEYLFCRVKKVKISCYPRR